MTAAALFASLFVGLSTAGAETVPTAVQFNMHGANGSASGHNTNVGQWTLNALRNTDPSSSSQSVWTASLNEACWSQWVFLWNNYFGIKVFKGRHIGPGGPTPVAATLATRQPFAALHVDRILTEPSHSRLRGRVRQLN